LALATIGYVWCSGFISLLVIFSPSRNGILGKKSLRKPDQFLGKCFEKVGIGVANPAKNL